MKNILTEDGLLNLDIERDLYQLDIKQKLNTVKQHPSGKDTFICPYDLKDQIGLFLNAYAIPYSYSSDRELKILLIGRNGDLKPI